MTTIKRIQSPPENLRDFVVEITPEIRRIYGDSAAVHYGHNAMGTLAATIAHPEIDVWCASAGDTVAAMLFAHRGSGRTSLSFFHVLRPFRGTGLDAEFLRHVLVNELAADVPLLTDYVPMCPLHTDGVYAAAGFRRVDRQLMAWGRGVPLQGTEPRGELRPLAPTEGPVVGRVLTQAYASHPDRSLFEEVQSTRAAQAFFDRILAGHFGAAAQLVGFWIDGKCEGIALGTQIYPRTGFVLHLAVTPAHQNRGLGGALLRALCERFTTCGARRVMLGVTRSNPAVSLYGRSGFETVQQLPVHFRGLEPAQPGS